jgi:hypothetical protein
MGFPGGCHLPDREDPFHVIIDPDGRVVASDLYGEKLLSTLDNILNN